MMLIASGIANVCLVVALALAIVRLERARSELEEYRRRMSWKYGDEEP